MKERVKIAQIGICHEHAAGKIVSLKRLPEVFEIVGVVNDMEISKTPRCGTPNLDPYKDLRWMTEEEVLNTPDLDAVVVEVPNNDLVPVALRCMERNLPMHMDKPAGEDPALYSAQPAPSGFESDSVVCSSTNRNNGRTAWDAKDEIVGRRNCQNIGTAA